MVSFDKKARTFQITVSGDEREYFRFMKALSHLLATQDANCLSKETQYYAATLLEEMLPADGQHVTLKVE